MFTEILDLGYSDHLAQFLKIKQKIYQRVQELHVTRHFTDNNVEEFKYLLHEET